ncbi:SAP domain-containing protein [Lactiplantibacillus plantarum]|uniref:SAP domain-containing protein n=1 Tax=Lactiplantibacillus plantarum TaxID=1590 RepID=UPI0032C49839
MTLNNFKVTYFYKTELIKLCREYHLPTYGTKAELSHYIYLYLSGTPAEKIKAQRKRQTDKSLTVDKITLETKLVGSGFTFNNAARKFFADYFNSDHFSFKKGMAIIKRQAEANNDTNITVGDVIKQSQKLQSNSTQRTNILTKTSEESTYQWNNVVKDFCQSPDSHRFTGKLKVAALLWKHVKQSKQSKQYSHDLVKKFSEKISSFRK